MTKFDDLFRSVPQNMLRHEIHNVVDTWFSKFNALNY